MSTGTNLMNRVLQGLSAAGATVFRNNTGMGWAGKSFKLKPGEVYRAKGGEVVVREARPLKAGLCTGSSDVIGFESVVITSAMVGSTVAVFLAAEVKDGKGRTTTEQDHFGEHVQRGGGIFVIARSVEDALSALFCRK